MSIEKSFVLSTGHMPQKACENAEFGDIRSSEHEYGHILFVCSNHEYEGDEIPDWLLPILNAAVKAECSFLVFDRDGELLDNFQTFNW